MKLSKQEQRYRARQQLANKFTQKAPPSWGWQYSESRPDKDAIKMLVNKVCK